MTARATWATDAQLITHAMAAFWADIHGVLQARRSAWRRKHVRMRGNVAILPPPIAGYRLRRRPDRVAIEIVTVGGYVSVLGHARDIESAREALAQIRRDHARPVLREVLA